MAPMTYSQQSIDSVICKMREDISSRPSELIYFKQVKTSTRPVKTFGSKPISWMYKPSAYRIKVRLFICK